MNFFRKHFVLLALALVGLAVVAALLHYFFTEKEKVIEITPEDLVFRIDAEAYIYKKDSLLQKIDVQMATTEEQRAVGLMYRSSMEPLQGMWFVFENEAPRSFYMKNTEISLDIIYVDKSKKVVSIAKNARPYDETSLPSEAPAMYVLEINGGLADKWGIEKGDRIEIRELAN